MSNIHCKTLEIVVSYYIPFCTVRPAFRVMLLIWYKIVYSLISHLKLLAPEMVDLREKVISAAMWRCLPGSDVRGRCGGVLEVGGRHVTVK